MRHITKLLVVAFVGIAVLTLGAAHLWACDFKKLSKNHMLYRVKKLSKNHILYGVSQLLVGGISPNPLNYTLVKLINPTPVTMVAIALFYEREGGPHLQDEPVGEPGTYLHCKGEILSPHAAKQLEKPFYNEENPKLPALYVEVISVPVKPVKIGKKGVYVADGLGIVGSPNSMQGNLFPVHPMLFSLPEEAQALEAAKECACQALETLQQERDLGTDCLNIFRDFGITCD